MNFTKFLNEAKRVCVKHDQLRAAHVWIPEINRHVMPLFYLVYKMEQVPMTHAHSFFNFAENFNKEFGTMPFDFDVASVFGNWPQDSFETWVQKAHTRYMVKSSTMTDQHARQSFIEFTVFGIIDQDLDQYLREFDQVQVMCKLAS